MEKRMVLLNSARRIDLEIILNILLTSIGRSYSCSKLILTGVPHSIYIYMYVSHLTKVFVTRKKSTTTNSIILRRISQRFILTTCPIDYRYYRPLRLKILYTSHLPQVLLAHDPAYFQSADLGPSHQ